MLFSPAVSQRAGHCCPAAGDLHLLNMKTAQFVLRAYVKKLKVGDPKGSPTL